MSAVPNLVQGAFPKILFLDIETAPINALVWTLYQTDVIHVLKPTYMLSFAYQWLGKPAVRARALCDYRGYKKGDDNDKALVTELWDLLDRADIVIAHNGDAFDIKKTNARFAVHGLPPPTPYKTVDTLKIARKHFKFDSNKLDNIGGYLNAGHKIAHTGKHLWLGCMSGDAKSWRTMKRYNAQDVRLLATVYEKIRAWSPNHPALTAISPQRKVSCPVCLNDNVQRRGWAVAKFKKSPRFQCQSVSCGHWFSGTQHLPPVASARVSRL